MEYQINNIFIEKSCRKCAAKASPIILVNSPKQPLRARNYFKRYLERGLSKSLKKVTFFFLLNPVPFNRWNYQKQNEPGTSDQSLFRLRNKFRKIPLLVMHYLTKFDDVIQSGFWVILKIKSANLCKTIYDINYSTSICPFESGKCGKEGKKSKKFEYLKNEKSFLDEIKNIWWKNKNLIKNSSHKL